MKKVKLLLGIGILSVILVSFEGSHNCDNANGHESSLPSDMLIQFEEKLFSQAHTVNIAMDELDYSKEEEIINLGFDTAQYLPEGFNAYKGMIFDLEDIIYVEDEEEFDLGFSTEVHLPEGFNPYATNVLTLEEIMFVEQEEIDLDFDTAQYLPQGFDPYEGMDLDAI